MSSNERGSILLGGLGIALVMTVFGLALFDLAVIESRLVLDRVSRTQACLTSEAALNRLWEEMGNGNGINEFSQVNSLSDGDTVSLANPGFDTGLNGIYGYTVTKAATLTGPTRTLLRATGTSPPTVTSPTGAQCVIEAVFSQQFGLPFALFGAEEVEIAGGTTLIDSYNSSKGTYNGDAAGSNGDVRSNNDIDIGGGATVKGDVAAGGTVTNGGTVTGTITSSATPPVSLLPDPVAPCGPPFYSGSGITGSFTYKDGELRIAGGGTAMLADGTYCFARITITGGGTLMVNGPVVVFLTERSDMAGGSIVNTTQKAANLQFLSSATGEKGEGTIKLTGGSLAYMTIYAPAGEVKVSGGGELFGAIVGKEVEIHGGARIHLDEALSNAPGLQGGIVTLKRNSWALVSN
ncbi:MAG: hypothetical protein HY695_38595 [Deltaproteobacteria bacterium]|nr:hypothetical protein [Deltaproteobacteria bacterium]